MFQVTIRQQQQNQQNDLQAAGVSAQPGYILQAKNRSHEKFKHNLSFILLSINTPIMFYFIIF